MIATVSIQRPLVCGSFLARKRFIVSVRTQDKVVKAFLPNTGRLSKILTPGAKLLLNPVPLRNTTPFDIIVGFEGTIPVVLDSRIPNTLIRKAFRNRELPEFQHYATVSSEVSVGGLASISNSRMAGLAM